MGEVRGMEQGVRTDAVVIDQLLDLLLGGFAHGW